MRYTSLLSAVTIATEASSGIISKINRAIPRARNVLRKVVNDIQKKYNPALYDSSTTSVTKVKNTKVGFSKSKASQVLQIAQVYLGIGISAALALSNGTRVIHSAESPSSGSEKKFDQDKQALNDKIEKIKKLIKQQKYSEASSLIKESLQFCQDILHKDKFLREEYELFNSLADIYSNRDNIRHYPKIIAIYEYLKELITKLDPTIQEQLQEEIQIKIIEIEEKFIKLYSKAICDQHTIRTTLEKIKHYKDKLEEFRDKIREDLKRVEGLGISAYEHIELDEDGLLQRAQEMEKIYRRIQNYFIGEQGLFKQLIANSIEELGGLPKVIKQGGIASELEYAFFGMGSLALCTMTPWSDFEGGILIEEGLSAEDEAKAKEFLRRVTILFQMKLIHFGETPLRMLGIAELNDFKGTADQKGKDWFFDDLIRSGVSFDGPHWYACKTPLGREEGYNRIIEDKEEIVPCRAYELIGTINELIRFQTESEWYKEDKFLVKALCNTVFIIGNRALMQNYQFKLSQNKELIQSRAFEILKSDSHEFSPTMQIFEEDQEGQIINVKKEIYRFPDRVVIALINCLGNIGLNSWTVRNLLINDKGRKNLYIALAIASELRLRTYVNNNSQGEDLSILSVYEFQAKKIKDTVTPGAIFYLQDTRILYRYYYTTLPFALSIDNLQNREELVLVLNQVEFVNSGHFIKGHIYKKLMRYNDAIREFESIIDNKTLKVRNPLGLLYLTIGRYEEAFILFEQNLVALRLKHQENYLDVAGTLHNMGTALQKLRRDDEALEAFEKSLIISISINKRNYMADAYLSMGIIYKNKGEYDKALEHLDKAYEIYKIIYRENHIAIAWYYNNRGIVYDLKGEYKKALKDKKKSLEIKKEIYKGEHPDIALTLQNIGVTYDRLNQHEAAIKCYEYSLNIQKRIYGKNHPAVADSLNNIGVTLRELGKYEEALEYSDKSLDMIKNIYGGKDHPNIIAYLINKGNVLAYLASKSSNTEVDKIGYNEAALVIYNEAIEMGRKVYKEDNINIAGLLDNKGSVLESLNRYNEALKCQKEALKIRVIIYNGENHSEVADSINNIGVTLASLGRYDEALENHKKALEIRKKVYKRMNHSEIATSLYNIGDVLELSGQYEEALKKKQESLEMNRKIYKEGHPAIAFFKNNINQCKLLLANQKMLTGNITEAASLYTEIGLNVAQLHKLMHIANSFFIQNQIMRAISCYEVLERIVYPNDINIKHNLACCYHVKALQEQAIDQKVGYMEHLEKSKVMFEKVINLETTKPSLNAEYAMLLVSHHDIQNLEEYEKINKLIQRATETSYDQSELKYTKAEKLIVVKPVQELLETRDEVRIKPYLLAYYLSVAIHNLHCNKQEAMTAFEQFQKATAKITDREEKELACHFLKHALVELDSDNKHLWQAKVEKQCQVASVQV